MHYFDHNASSPLCPAARDAWLDATARFPGNASSPHRMGARADNALGQAREKLAGWLGCPAQEIVWTSGATESNNTVIRHFAQGPGREISPPEIWVSAIEHPSVLAPARRLFPGNHRAIPVSGQGLVQMDWLRENLARAKPGLIAVMAANNETGVCQPWQEIAALCQQHGVSFFCDAAQWLGKMPADGLGLCDFVSGCAHKFGGPQGVGFLKCPARLHPLLHGGPQEEGRRAGTENLAGILSMIAALEDRQQISPETLGQAKAQFEAALCQALPEAELVGVGAPRLWNTVCAVMPAIDCRQRWVVKLDKLGFAVSTGSACASGQEHASHVLGAMGMAPEKASRVLRFSTGWEPAEWLALLAGICRAAQELGDGPAQGRVGERDH